ncbi:hypothetical protein NQ317_010931 [Molorchus minor]|uniref:Uncharacterized protein n=1 Tax=Molorchus minor TaxID=1323400 RepID=A0ABQ9J4H2_9CUCU|nr:hypothetical protein NQ317_010931 [Molorchus minor]
MLNIHRYRLRASSCPDIYRNSMTTIAKEKVQWYAGLWDLWDLLVDIFDVSHFADPKYFVFAMSNFLLYTWYDVPYVYLTDNARENGFSKKDASMLISIIGIVNMIGEIILGWAGDRAWANASIIYAVCMGFCGGLIALIPLITDYLWLSVVAGAFWLLDSGELLANLYHTGGTHHGVANLIGPPLGGILYDITGTYDLSFYLAGLFIALSGLMLLILPVTKRYKRFIRRQESSEASIKEESPKEPKPNIFFVCKTKRGTK